MKWLMLAISIGYMILTAIFHDSKYWQSLATASDIWMVGAIIVYKLERQVRNEILLQIL